MKTPDGKALRVEHGPAVERARWRRGKPYYVWHDGYFVVVDGVRQHPPVLLTEARRQIRKLAKP